MQYRLLLAHWSAGLYICATLNTALLCTSRDVLTVKGQAHISADVAFGQVD